jgi:tRNA(Ile)-lysidine synthase
MFHKGERVLLGVSGGPDSVALLYVLEALKKNLGLKLHIAHLDHRLRKDSYKDAEFVKDLADKFNLPATIAAVDIKRLAKKGSIEEVSRQQRLKFFKRLTKNYSIQKIALGHNQDDQAETVLMRILRGSGLYGLQAIAPVRTIEGLVVVRPLIEISRKEINSYLAKKKVVPCIDFSNLESVFFRNRIRNKLIPLLESRFNKNIKKSLSNLAEIIALDYDFLAHQAQKKLRAILAGCYAKTVRLDSKRFLKLPIALQRMIMRLVIARLLGSTRKFDFRHWQEIEDLVRFRPIGAIVDLPKGLCVKKEGKKLCFCLRKR